MPKRMTFKDKIKTRSGRCFDDEIIYVTTNNGMGIPSFVHGRRISRNRIITNHNIQFGEKFRQTVDLYKRLPQLFRDDLGQYVLFYNGQHRFNQKPITGFNIFVGVLMNHPVQIYSLTSLSQTMGNTVREWIENGKLKQVDTSNPFNASMI